MKLSLLGLMALLVTISVAPAQAGTMPPQNVIEFSPGPDTSGEWSYNGAGVLSFDHDIFVDTAWGSNYDALTGARVYLPSFQVGGIPDAPYTLTPLGNEVLTIKSADNSVTYMTGTIGGGNLATFGTVAGGFTEFQVDITDVFVSHEGAALGSTALYMLESLGLPSLDFELSLQGGSGPGYYSFAHMLDGGFVGSGGFSGAMSVPEPTTIALLAMGGLVVARRRRT